MRALQRSSQFKGEVVMTIKLVSDGGQCGGGRIAPAEGEALRPERVERVEQQLPETSAAQVQ
jgi:hypothetical protein